MASSALEAFIHQNKLFIKGHFYSIKSYIIEAEIQFQLDLHF